MLVISTQNWSILAKFAKKNPAKSAVFYWLFLGEVSTRNFPWNRPIFLRICTWKSFENWLFCAKIPRNRPIVPRILTFPPQKSHEIGRFFRAFALENPAKFCFFSAKYLRPWCSCNAVSDETTEKMAAAKCRLQCMDYVCCGGHLTGMFVFNVNYFLWRLKISTRGLSFFWQNQSRSFYFYYLTLN